MKIFYIYLTALFAVPALLLAKDIEEVTVSSAFLDSDVSSINNPIHVIQYSDFSKKGVSTLAESIDNLLGCVQSRLRSICWTTNYKRDVW